MLVSTKNGEIMVAGNYLFKVNNRNTRKRCEIYSKLIKEHQNDVTDAVLVFVLLTLNIFHTFLA